MKRSENVLLRHGWLSDQAEIFRTTVLATGQMRDFRRGSTIYSQGDEPGGIYGIVTGVVGVTIAPGETGPHLAHLASPGSWFGEGCFLTGQPRRVGLEAAEDCRLFCLQLDAMERIAAADPENIRRFAQISMLNIDLALRVIDDLLIPNPDRRIAATLLRSLGGRDCGSVRLTQADLGHLANASRKVVNGALRRFSACGWVTPGYSTMAVADAATLRAFATGMIDLP